MGTRRGTQHSGHTPVSVLDRWSKPEECPLAPDLIPPQLHIKRSVELASDTSQGVEKEEDEEEKDEEEEEDDEEEDEEEEEEEKKRNWI
ncbi:unnamed protein product [Schistocephalus solidus]|uniref:Uncharacterized protein n=1 Tax=Schistocephalus solidus TaxID=70667 RepID=A0A183SKV7_SCHSO|nr:unnamed protein product [Schistocephalus solidus]